MHAGTPATLAQVITFYQPPSSPFSDNRDPLVPAPIPPDERGALMLLVRHRNKRQNGGSRLPYESSITSHVGFGGSVAGRTQRISA